MEWWEKELRGMFLDGVIFERLYGVKKGECEETELSGAEGGGGGWSQVQEQMGGGGTWG